MIGDDTLNDPPDGRPADPEQRLPLALGHLLGAEGDEVLEVPRLPGGAARPRDRLDAHPAVATLDASELVLKKAAMAGEIDMPPAAKLSVVHSPVGLPAPRTGDPPPAQAHPDDHPLAAQPDAGDARIGERQSLFNAVVTCTPSS